jgi:hypothetical protein
LAWSEIVSDSQSVTLQDVLLAAARRFTVDDKAAARLAEIVLHRLSDDPDLLLNPGALTDVMQKAADELIRQPAPAARQGVI